MKEDVSLSQFGLGDLDSISEKLESDYDNFWNYNVLRQELMNAHSFFWCLKKETEIVGFSGISVIIDIAELNNIVIKKFERGKGYSKLLLNKMIEIAKDKDCRVIQLEVSATNEIAINLYESLGFKYVGTRKGYYNGIDALLYNYDL